MAPHNLEQPISPDSQLFQSFPTEVAQNDLKWPILPNLQLFQFFPTKVAQNDSEQPILHGKKKEKNTMIQRNFYERLHFYMDSCAISPTASLLPLREHSGIVYLFPHASGLSLVGLKCPNTEVSWIKSDALSIWPRYLLPGIGYSEVHLNIEGQLTQTLFLYSF